MAPCFSLIDFVGRCYVLPLVIPEKQIFGFEFWFNGTIYQGMYYRGELFCRLGIYDIKDRPHVYRLGIRLAKNDALTLLSCATETCSLWGSLRAAAIKEFLINPGQFETPEVRPVVVEKQSDRRPDESG